MESKNNQTKTYPAPIIFKSIFRYSEGLHVQIEAVLKECEIDGVIKSRESRNSKFISYTVSAEFPSEESLQRVCRLISELKGFMMMF